MRRAPRTDICTEVDLQEVSHRLQRAATVSATIDTLYARRIAFAMGCSETSRLASGCPSSMRKLPVELVQRILALVNTTEGELAALDRVDAAIAEIMA